MPILFHVLIFSILINVNHLLQGFPLLLPPTRPTRASATTTAVAAATPAKIGSICNECHIEEHDINLSRVGLGKGKGKDRLNPTKIGQKK